MMLLWLFPLLISLPHAQGRRDSCSGAFPEINRTIRFNVSGETHCVFVPPNDDNVLKSLQPERGEWAKVFTLNITAARQQCGKFDAGLVQLRTGAVFEASREKIKYELLGIDKSSSHEGPFIPVGMVVQSIGNWTMNDNQTRSAYTVKWDNGDVVTMKDMYNYPDGALAFWRGEVYVGRPVILTVGDRTGTFSTANATTFETYTYGGMAIVCHQEPLGPEQSSPSPRPTTPSGTKRSIPFLLQSTTTSCASLPVVLPSPVLSLALGIVICDWTNGQ